MEAQIVYNELVKSAQKWPDHPAIHDAIGTMTYSELLTEVELVKDQLLKKEVQNGMGLGVKARNGRNFIVAVFAVLGCGAAAMPVSHQLKRRELEEIIDRTQLHAIIDDNSGIIAVEGGRESLRVSNDALYLAFTNVPKNHLFAAHVTAPAFVRFTSGTTGESKGVIIDNQSVIERTDAANKALKLDETSNVVWVMPMAYHFVVSIVLYIRVGAAITIVRDFMAKDTIRMTNKYRGTMLYASPMQIRLLAADRGEEMMDSLKLVISTSSGISNEVSRSFKKRFNKTVHQAFGIIEVGLPIINTEEDEAYIDCVGRPLPDYDVKVFDEEYNVLPNGEVGMLGIKGPGMFSAYMDPPKLREEVLINGYFFSADYASISEEGVVKIEGRKKSMINVSGNKVFAEEVEHVLEELAYISKAKVSGVPHPLMGQIIQAEVELSSDEEVDLEATLSYCRKRLSTFKIPQKLIVVDEMKMTDSGKLVRH